MTLLDVQVVGLSECLVSPGFKLELGPSKVPGIHYILAGSGKLHIQGSVPVELKPHTLVIMPPHLAFQLEVPAHGEAYAATSVAGHTQKAVVDSINRFTAGDSEPKTLMICGYFHALYGSSTDIFETLSKPIVEQFDAGDRLDERLKSALEELATQEIGAGAMSAALLKQVVVALLRRSLKSNTLWVERFAMLSDPQIARAFADMVARPGAPHTVCSLAESACLSRSAFMARFSSVIGRAPMQILRDLRMRQAAAQLSTGAYTIDQVVRNAGYASRSSFARVFKEIYRSDPSEYREAPHVRSRTRTEIGPDAGAQAPDPFDVA